MDQVDTLVTQEDLDTSRELFEKSFEVMHLIISSKIFSAKIKKIIPILILLLLEILFNIVKAPFSSKMA